MRNFVPYQYFQYLRSCGVKVSADQVQDIIEYTKSVNPANLSLANIINVYSSIICKNDTQVENFVRISLSYFNQYKFETLDTNDTESSKKDPKGTSFIKVGSLLFALSIIAYFTFSDQQDIILKISTALLIPLTILYLFPKIRNLFREKSLTPPFDYELEIVAPIPGNIHSELLSAPQISKFFISSNQLDIQSTVQSISNDPLNFQPFFKKIARPRRTKIYINSNLGFYNFFIKRLEPYFNSHIDVISYMSDIRVSDEENLMITENHWDTIIIIDKNISYFDKINGGIYLWFEQILTTCDNLILYTQNTLEYKSINIPKKLNIAPLELYEVLKAVLNRNYDHNKFAQNLYLDHFSDHDLQLLKRESIEAFNWICCLAIPQKLSWNLIFAIGIELEKEFGRFIDLKTMHLITKINWIESSYLKSNRTYLLNLISNSVITKVSLMLVQTYQKQDLIKPGSFGSKLFSSDFNITRQIYYSHKKLELDGSQRSTFPIEKRIFDIAFSSLTIIFLSPIFLLIALLIKLESKGPILYVSKRAGQNYKVFDFYKFRTMAQDADSMIKELKLSHSQYNDGQQFFKIKNDPRITKLGNFLRMTSLDELPQFFNVWKGDMSIVGNRPLPLYEAELLQEDERFLAPGGITGLWQVMKRGRFDMSLEERIKLDRIYSRKYSFWYDLKIIAMTIPAMFQEENI